MRRYPRQAIGLLSAGSCVGFAGCGQPKATSRVRPKMSAWGRVAGEQYCYLTTRGRVSGRPHRIEIWFAIDDGTLYMLSGGGRRSDWVKNLLESSSVKVEVGGLRLDGQARIVLDPSEDERARALVHDKYAAGYSGDLSEWRRSALPIAVELQRWQATD